MIVTFDEMKNELSRGLKNHGFSAERAEESADLFTWNTVDGIASHGVNRFPRVIEYLKKGYIDVDAVPTKTNSLGALEQWNGNLGMGNLNAKICMNRAMELASEYGIGCVALGNTNHWMRGGAYGWQAADNGYAGICWTNTQPNTPPWGSSDRKIGNNPFIVAIPREKGNLIVDVAMAQYSYGKIEQAQMNNEMLPFPGGFDSKGNLTSDPAEISKTWRVLPIGYWKGSGMSIVLDLLAATLSGGKTVREVGTLGGDEYSLSQIFIALNIHGMNSPEWVSRVLDESIEDIKNSTRVDEHREIMYPGEPELRTREKHLKHGMDVNDQVWETIKNL